MSGRPPAGRRGRHAFARAPHHGLGRRLAACRNWGCGAHMMPTTLCGAVQNFTMRPPPTPFGRSLRNDRANPTGCEEAEHLASFRLSYPPPDRDWLAAHGIVLAAGLDPFKGKGNPRRFARCRATLPGRCARLGGGRPSRPVADSDTRGGWGGLTDEAGAFVAAWFWLPEEPAPRRRSVRLRSCRAAAEARHRGARGSARTPRRPAAPP
jgi:hypothetical protein